MSGPLPFLRRIGGAGYNRLLDALEWDEVPFDYAEACAAMAFDHTEMVRVRKVGNLDQSIYDFMQVGQDLTDFVEGGALWRWTPKVTEVVGRYHRMNIDPTDFHPYIEPVNVERIQAAGHSVHVLGQLTSGGMIADSFVIGHALKMPVEFSEAALAAELSIDRMRDLHRAGLADPYVLLRRGSRALKVASHWCDGGRPVVDVVACIRVFPEHLWELVNQMGVTAGQAAKVMPGVGLLLKTRMDILEQIHPELPREYLVAMDA